MVCGCCFKLSRSAMVSVLTTAMSRINAFLDSELEQILCFDGSLDTETFCNEKSAIFLVLLEEENTKYFMVSLFLQQLYREMLTIADEHGGKLPNRVMVFADEIGTIPKIQSMEMMFSAGRSRRISMVPIIQSFAQLERNYEKEEAAIIIDNCQDILFGGFAPNSESAEILSKALGNQTVMSGSISRGKNDPSQSLQMIQRPLMTPDELKTLPKGQFILAKTGYNPMRTKLPPGMISYDYHYHTGDSEKGSGCYTKKLYHQHSPACYAKAACTVTVHANGGFWSEGDTWCGCHGNVHIIKQNVIRKHSSCGADDNYGQISFTEYHGPRIDRCPGGRVIESGYCCT